MAVPHSGLPGKSGWCSGVDWGGHVHPTFARGCS